MFRFLTIAASLSRTPIRQSKTVIAKELLMPDAAQMLKLSQIFTALFTILMVLGGYFIFHFSEKIRISDGSDSETKHSEVVENQHSLLQAIIEPEPARDALIQHKKERLREILSDRKEIDRTDIQQIVKSAQKEAIAQNDLADATSEQKHQEANRRAEKLQLVAKPHLDELEKTYRTIAQEFSGAGGGQLKANDWYVGDSEIWWYGNIGMPFVDGGIHPINRVGIRDRELRDELSLFVRFTEENFVSIEHSRSSASKSYDLSDPASVREFHDSFREILIQKFARLIKIRDIKKLQISKKRNKTGK